MVDMNLLPENSIATSSCLAESVTFNSVDNVCGVNPSQGGTFVKVCVPTCAVYFFKSIKGHVKLPS